MTLTATPLTAAVPAVASAAQAATPAVDLLGRPCGACGSGSYIVGPGSAHVRCVRCGHACLRHT